MARFNREEEVVRRAPLTDRQKDLMLCVLIRSATAFKRVANKLSPKHFYDARDKYRSVLLAALMDYWAEFDEAPAVEPLMTAIDARLEQSPDFLEEEEIQALEALIGLAFELNDEEISVRIGLIFVQRLVDEYLTVMLSNTLSEGAVLDNLPKVLADVLRNAESARSLQSGEADVPFPETIEELKAVALEPTGLTFLDEYMGGGVARREVVGFCGPYGSCKTTMGIMLAVNRARWEQMERLKRDDADGPLPIVYYFSWEEDKTLLQPRFLCYAARVRSASLVGANYFSELSTVDNLKTYERRMFAESLQRGAHVEGERERIERVMKQLNRNLRIIDFSGSDERYRDQAGNMAEGIRMVIEQDQEARDNPGVSYVVCDYVGAAAKVAIQRHGWDHSTKLRHLIGEMPLNMKNLVATPMNCPVWLLHQLGTEANSRAAGVAPKTTDMAEAKNFAENLNFLFAVGSVDKQGMTVLTNGKQRRTQRQADRVLLVQGDFGLVTDVSSRYVIQHNRIVSQMDRARVVDDPEDMEVTHVRKHDSLMDFVGE